MWLHRRDGLTRRRSAVVLAAALLGSACTSGSSSTPASSTTTTVVPTSPATDPTTPPTTGVLPPESFPREIVDGFDDHTISSIASIAEFDALARSGVSGQSVVKFAIPDMTDSDDVRWLDSNFYEVHDEWYWFRLMNGRRVPGFDTDPYASDRTFDTVDDIVEWVRDTSRTPLDLRFVASRTYGERLYSPTFYAEAMPDDRRNFGLGALVLFPDAADGQDHWLMELEFSDVPTAEEVRRYFDLLASSLPSEIGDALEWVVRSPAQDAVAASMESSQDENAHRIVRWSDLVTPGVTAVYNGGIAAGRLLVVDGVNTQLSDATERDIVLIEHVPDRLPPAAALITSSPQTPLAHVNLLARNRGIPNASRSGVLDDANLRQAARVRAPAVVSATSTGELDIVLITSDEYRQWRDLQEPSRVAVQPVELETMPLVIDLTTLADGVVDESDIERVRPVIGGKSAGFLTLLTAPGVAPPPDPLAITVRPYFEHLEPVGSALDEMLELASFRDDAEVRLAFLEGPDALLDDLPGREDLVDRLLDEHPDDTPLGAILAGGGLRRVLRAQPIEPSTLDHIIDRLDVTYGDYAATQGLRFRSSSSVEDIEGFNGAGLYDSNTGFLVPDPNDDARDRTIEDAIADTWSSYWAFEAFEERRLAGVDHRSGGMGVTVHARFDDELELINGVATISLLPARDADTALVEVNVQPGSRSVANPEPGELPEVIAIRRSDIGSVRWERLAASSVETDGEVMTDDQLVELLEQLEAIAELWRERVNASLVPAQRVEALTLDIEFKAMAAGWPAVEGGGTAPSRLVVKQARSLEPGLGDVDDDVLDLPIPRDVLARSITVRRTCPDRADGTAVIEVLTDPLVAPDMGYAVEPFTATVFDDDCRSATLAAAPKAFLLELLAAHRAGRPEG